jgi:hypothetical protein
MALGKFLTVDPGEDTGWSVWDGRKLVDAGTTKMWDFSDTLWAVGMEPLVPSLIFDLPDDLQEIAQSIRGIEILVTENWTIYPWVAHNGGLDWDECRTARLIGSMYSLCRLTGWHYEQQPAKIKERAVAAGAETYFSHPLKENRHANDAIMHGVFRNAVDAGAPWADLGKSEWTA